MDLGIWGRTALVCASTRGLGRAGAEALAAEGVSWVVIGRHATSVTDAARDIAERFGIEARGVVADLSTPDGRRRVLEACPDPDILVTNNAGPSPAVFTEVTAEAWAEALQANMLGAIELVQGVLPGMRARHFGRIVNITSAMVKSPHPLMTPSIGARAGLTGVMKAVARDVVVDNVTVNNLLPERIDTDRQRQMAELAVAVRGITLDEAYAEIAATIPARRLGRAEEVGTACAFLCADGSGYLTGQNLQLDGAPTRGSSDGGATRADHRAGGGRRPGRHGGLAPPRPTGRGPRGRGAPYGRIRCAGDPCDQRTDLRDPAVRRRRDGTGPGRLRSGQGGSLGAVGDNPGRRRAGSGALRTPAPARARCSTTARRRSRWTTRCVRTRPPPDQVAGCPMPG